MEQIIFIDVETTGLNPALHEIIEIAIVGDNFAFNTKIKPQHIETASEEALKMNGYSEDEWKYAMPPEAAALEIAKHIQGARIVGHNVRFDMDFIEELLHKYDVDVWYDRRLIDTITLAHEHLIDCGIKSVAMDSIRSFFGWSMVGAHTALKDAQDCKRLYYKLSRASKLHRLLWKHQKKLKHLLKMLL